MVSEDLNSNSNVLHEFIMSGQNQYPNQQFNVYGVEINTPHLGLFPSRMYRSMEFGDLSEESEDNEGMNLIQAQRLSLSLGSQYLVVPAAAVECSRSSHNTGYAEDCREEGRESVGVGGGICNSRYLKLAQSLLEEVVSVDGNKIVQTNDRKLSSKLGIVSELRAELELSNTDHNLLVVNDKYELQLRLSKLVSLLEEVEVRYERYCNHLEQLVSPFELLAGKSYTALALQAISKHFCNLRDAILSQICYARKNLYPKIGKLSLVDNKENHQNRMSSSLQHLGMLQCSRQTWKPIRGLPETSVTILRSWLFQHFLNPYPNESEKLILASQTGLTKNQVSNWFINARVRLWKPMIEEMYKEEFADESDRGGVSDSTQD